MYVSPIVDRSPHLPFLFASNQSPVLTRQALFALPNCTVNYGTGCSTALHSSCDASFFLVLVLNTLFYESAETLKLDHILENADMPWITYTSTRSCTIRPSTVFVQPYTSNSTNFLLPQPGPISAITPLYSTAPILTSETSISTARNDGFATGAEGTSRATSQASSGPAGSMVSMTGSDDPSGTPRTAGRSSQSFFLGHERSDLSANCVTRGIYHPLTRSWCWV